MRFLKLVPMVLPGSCHATDILDVRQGPRYEEERPLERIYKSPFPQELPQTIHLPTYRFFHNSIAGQEPTFEPSLIHAPRGQQYPIAALRRAKREGEWSCILIVWREVSRRFHLAFYFSSLTTIF